MAKNALSGQVLLRKMGTHEGRTLFMVVGLLAVPADQAWLDEHQYPVLGTPGHLVLDAAAPIDRFSQTRGLGAEGLLTAPIWRV